MHLGHSASSIGIAALNRLEVYDGSLVQVVKLRMMPVGFGTAKILLVGSVALGISADYWNIVLDIF